MSNIENREEGGPELVEVEPGLFAFKDLTRNPPEVRDKLLKEIKELVESLHEK
jgi:hypothetical protein